MGYIYKALQKDRHLGLLNPNEVLFPILYPHDYIVSYIDIVYKNYMHVSMDFYPHNMMKYVKDHPEELSRIREQFLIAVKHIHSHGYLHNDLHIDNILIDNKGNVKIIDFGACYPYFVNIFHIEGKYIPTDIMRREESVINNILYILGGKEDYIINIGEYIPHNISYRLQNKSIFNANGCGLKGKYLLNIEYNMILDIFNTK